MGDTLEPIAFAYWLQGFVELHGQPPTPQQWEQIKEHLALVFTKVTQGPDFHNTLLTPSGLSLDRAAAVSHDDPAGKIRDGAEIGITVVDAEGKRELIGWDEFYRRQNATKVFITVSRRPSYNALSYSYYPFHGDSKDRAAQEAFLTSLGVRRNKEEVFCVVDNALEPRITELNQLSGGADHLTSFHPRSPGIVNVGVGPDLIC